MKARRLELACWVVALALAATFAAGTTSTTAGAATLRAVGASQTEPAGPAILAIWRPAESSGWCIKEVIEFYPRGWSSSRDLSAAIDRLCFPTATHRALQVPGRTRQITCVRTFGWRPALTPGRMTGCLVD